MSQSPSLRGSGRFGEAEARAEAEQRVSIPFIAGQWSLRCLLWTRSGAGVSSQSPSLRGSGRFRCTRIRIDFLPGVSIPFIAGQWSLLDALRRAAPPPAGFNPLHCGAVVASGGASRVGTDAAQFQSPSLRGSGRFHRVDEKTLVEAMFQSPSLRGSGRFVFLAQRWPVIAGFQSPSLRGSGRFRGS